MRDALLKVIDHKATPYVIMIAFAMFMLSPFIWMTLSSLKTHQETFMSPPTYLPEQPTLEAFSKAWFEAPIPTYLYNSLFTCVLSTIIVIVAGAFTAFALSQFPYKGSNWVLGLFLFTRTIPPMAMLLPYYLILMKMHLLNTRTAIILYLIYLNYPLVVWLLKGFL
jgi:ABC-type glycerol-3-phosphate transport system permease component